MAFADYQVVFYHPTTGDLIDLIDNRRIYGLQYNRIVNGIGRIALTVLGSDRINTLNGRVESIFGNQTNLIMEVLRSTNGITFEVEDTYLVRDIERYSDENDIDMLVISGEHCHAFLRDTLIIPEDDPNEANGFSTKSGIADLVMYGFVLDQCISPAVNSDRARPYITNAASQNYGQTIFMRKSYDNLLEVLYDATVRGLVDFYMRRTAGANFQFEVLLQGRDLSYTTNYPGGPVALFAPERGNIRNPRLRIGRSNEITVTYVATQGIEEDRIITPVQSPEVYQPLNRRENIIDQREIEDDSDLLTGINTAGAAELRAKQPEITFDFDVNTEASGGRYQLDWQLGDIITSKYGDFQIDQRIMEVEVNLQINGGTTSAELITPTFRKLFS
jgi:hypothetical protein